MATTVTVGQLQLNGDPTLYQADSNNGANVWNDFFVRSRYEKDRGTYMMGINSPTGFQGNSTAFVQLFAPTLLWIVEWTASRFNVKPKIPNPESQDPNWVLLDDHWELAPIVLAPDGETPLYRISGVYVYGCKNPNNQTYLDVRFPIVPWIQDIFTRTVSQQDLSDTIISPGQAARVGSSSSAAARVPPTS